MTATFTLFADQEAAGVKTEGTDLDVCVKHHAAAADPGVANDVNDGVSVGDEWTNTSTGIVWKCISNAAGAAIWRASQCKAWLNFDGSSNAIKSSFNISSITKNGTGDFTINFSNPLLNVDYAISGVLSIAGFNILGSGVSVPAPIYPLTRALNSVRVLTYTYTGSTNTASAYDFNDISILIHGD